MTRERTVVVKIGSNSLVDGQGRLDLPFLDAVAAQLAAAAKAGLRPVVVTSGAVANGVARLGLKERPAGLPERQALAAIGQIGLVNLWESALARQGLPVAQLLLTHDDFTHRGRYLNLVATVRALTAYGAIPVINENDPVAVEELTVGDNDRLSALVATQLGAERLLLLTDIDGLYDADPRHDPSAKLLTEVAAITPRILAAAGGAGARGRGGMRSKVEAARLCAGAGVVTHIASARAPRVIARILAGEAVGTTVHARGERADARKRWLAARKVKGQIRIDAGAVAALVERGRSLLPAGVKAVDGRFAAGDTVAIVDAEGVEVARGLAALPSEELAQVCGRRSDQVATILGYQPKAAVHRDDLIVL